MTDLLRNIPQPPECSSAAHTNGQLPSIQWKRYHFWRINAFAEHGKLQIYASAEQIAVQMGDKALHWDAFIWQARGLDIHSPLRHTVKALLREVARQRLTNRRIIYLRGKSIHALAAAPVALLLCSGSLCNNRVWLHVRQTRLHI